MKTAIPALILCFIFISCASMSDYENTLKNFNYPNKIPGTGLIKMEDGYFEQELKPGSMSMAQASYIFGAHGDLDGDSAEDMASVIAVSGSGEGTYYYLYILVKSGEEYKYKASALLGDRIKIKTIKIGNKKIGVQYLKHSADDEKNNPTISTTSIYTLYGEKILKLK